MLWVAEFGRIYKSSENRLRPNGDLDLAPKDFESLLDLLNGADDASAADPEQPDYGPFFVYAQPYGQPQLKVQNYVGLIRTASGLQIEVLPKLAKHTDPDQARELLVKMLIELHDSPFREANAADLAAHRMPLFEILIRHFLKLTAGLVRKGIARAYVAEEANLPFLRGKLQMTGHIRHNSVNAAHFYCEYDEYQANRPINRLLRAALDVAARLSRQTVNVQQSRELLFWFDAVPPSRDVAGDFRSVRMDRLIQHYRPVMPIAKLLLLQLNPLTQQGGNKAIALLFPMEKVFEDFVAAKLHKQLVGWHIRTQIGGQALVESHQGRKMFSLIPDLLLSRDGRQIIADTKWKLIDQTARANKYNINQPDIYQLFAYAKKYLSSEGIREVYLIYPASEKFDRPLAPFWYEQGKEVLHVLPFDIKRNVLILPHATEIVATFGNASLLLSA